MIPIIVCTLGSPTVEVMKKSVEVYSPDTKFIVHHVERSSFGECYNKAMSEAFKKYDEIIIANDDVVITPTTIPILMEDVEKLKRNVDVRPERLGFVATLVDNGRMSQNVRVKFFGDNDEFHYGKWKSELVVKQSPVVAPIFAYISKVAFQAAQFPPLNWYSDDIMCDDLEKAGFKNFISRSYVHHVGSYTVGSNYDKLSNEAMGWIVENRPDFLDEIQKRKYYNKV